MNVRKPVVLFSMALISALGVTSANADMLIDRGLPTANLNNVAGANRSNVDWLTPDALTGDTFTNTSSQTWSINKIRLWTDGANETAILWGGVAGSSIGIVAPSGVITGGITYANGQGYQSSSGGFYGLNQVDFAVNITLAAGQTYDFLLGGTSSDSGYGLPFVEASNAALSGSPQQGADGVMLTADLSGGSVTTWTSLGNGWDKASDVNVQVFGSAIAPIPEPETYAMMLAGLGLLGVVARRRKQKAVA